MILSVAPVTHFLIWKLYVLRDYPTIFHIPQVTRKNSVYVSLRTHCISFIPAAFKVITRNLTCSHTVMMKKHANVRKMIDGTTEMSKRYHTSRSCESIIIPFDHFQARVISDRRRHSNVRCMCTVDADVTLIRAPIYSKNVRARKHRRFPRVGPVIGARYSDSARGVPVSQVTPHRTSVVPPGHT